MKTKKILFICSQNSNRSQIAEAFFNFYTKEKNLNWTGESAGTMPAEKINPEAIKSMQKKGIDISSQKPKKFNSQKFNNYDKIISFGCLSKNMFDKNIQKKFEQWNIFDNKEENQDKIRDDIENEVKKIIAKMVEKFQQIP
ncbi:low molecular weight phosphatase family protein [Patescibacteria group bacterium]|nr:low molecular weight phosphatase family protein [Patescibacteria group bacterium]